MKEKEEDRTVRTRVILCARARVSELFSYDCCQSRKSAALCARHTHSLKLVQIVRPRVCALENGAET